MATAHDQIIDALIAILLASPPLAGGEVAEDVDYDLVPEGVDQAISISFMASTPSQAGILGAPVDWETAVRVRCHARRDGATSGSRASRVLHGAVFARLMANRDLGLPESAGVDVQPPRLTSDSELMGTRMGCLDAVYIVTHRTRGASLDAP